MQQNIDEAVSQKLDVSFLNYNFKNYEQEKIKYRFFDDGIMGFAHFFKIVTWHILKGHIPNFQGICNNMALNMAQRKALDEYITNLHVICHFRNIWLH